MTKRARIGTPEKGKCWDFKNLQKRLSEDLEAKIKGMMNAVGELKPLNPKDFRDALADIFGKFVVPILEDQGSLMSDLIEGISCMEEKVQEMKDDKAKDAERIKMLEKCRESVELKGSRKDMTERVTVASKQFKVLDIDFGKELTERKELLAAAREKLSDKVRSDKRGRYNELIKNASMQVLARATMKRKDQKGDQEIWTGPER
jgi:hypothetical protein